VAKYLTTEDFSLISFLGSFNKRNKDIEKIRPSWYNETRETLRDNAWNIFDNGIIGRRRVIRALEKETVVYRTRLCNYVDENIGFVVIYALKKYRPQRYKA